MAELSDLELLAELGVETAPEPVRSLTPLQERIIAGFEDIQRFVAEHGLGGDPYDPHDNIIAGSAYIRTLFDRYGTPGWIAAYNAGPGRYEAWLRGRPLPSETRAYVATVAPNLAEGGILQRARTAIILRIDWTRSPLFVAQQRDAAAATPLPRERMPSEAAKPPISGADPAKAPRSNGLFVARGDQGTRP